MIRRRLTKPGTTFDSVLDPYACFGWFAFIVNKFESSSGCLYAIFHTILVAAAVDYFDSNILVPLLGALISGIIAHPLMNPLNQPMVPAVALQGGRLFWLAFGIIFIASMRSATDVPASQGTLYPYGETFDAGVQMALILWVAYQPVLLSVTVASLYTTLSLWVIGRALMSSVVPPDLHKALILDLLLGIGIIALLFAGLFRIWSEDRAARRANPWRNYENL